MATKKRSGKRIGALLAGLALALLAGCKDETIERYQVPRPPQQRLLGAIIPRGERTWFFKLVGPQDVVDKHAAEFRQFIQSLSFPEKGRQPIAWRVPEEWGWREEPGEKLRYATFKIGPREDPLELTVIPLGGGGTLLSNVNRWRDQMGLPRVTEDDLGRMTSDLKVGDDIKGTWVDIKAADEPGRGGKGAKP